MKTKELIRQLQEKDPGGEEEVCVGNEDIFFVEYEPAYYDGSLQILVRDEEKKPYYNIVGAKFRRSGSKIQIHTVSIAMAIMDNPDLPVEFIGGKGLHYEEDVQNWRDESRRNIEDGR